MRDFANLPVLALLVNSVFAQAPPPAAGSAQPAAAPARFEAADVHFTPPYRVPFYFGATIHDDRFMVRQATLPLLIATAYDLSGYVGGGPTWLAQERYDIVAKVPVGTTMAAARPMLQNLLAERFKLFLHPGDVPTPAYLLTVANGQPNLKPSASGEGGSCKIQPHGAGSIPPIVLECRGASIETLANTLVDMRGGGYVGYGRPVVDETGLKGTYDFDLKWTPYFGLPRSGSTGISLFKALDQQLGLKLEYKTAPRPGLMIDSVNREPTPNSPDLAKIMPPLPPPQFEVATIRATEPNGRFYTSITGDELNYLGIPLRWLINWAWDLNGRDDNSLVGPGWVESDRFDIHAKVASAYLGNYSTGRSQTINLEDFRLMVRTLLIDRFQIKYHVEDRPIDAYTLVAVDPRLTRADPSGRSGCGDAPGRDGIDPRMTNIMLNSLETCLNTTMDEFASQLHRIAADYFFNPVKDATGLQGRWDFTISWSSANLTQQGEGPGQGPADGSPTASEPNGALSFSDAIRKELGLKIVKEKRPGHVLVIDQINEKPTEN